MLNQLISFVSHISQTLKIFINVFGALSANIANTNN